MKRKTRTAAFAIGLFLAALLIAACGGGGGASTISVSPGPADPDPVPQLSQRPASRLSSDTVLKEAVRSSGQMVGVGPAFRHERPAQSDLDTATQIGNSEYRSGRWHDVQGRDGSTTASEILAFIRSFLRQAIDEAGHDIDLYSVDYGEQKTLRIGSETRQNERKAILQSLQNINTALPYQQRILLGEDISERANPDEITEGEIHIHVTSGKEGWPREIFEDDEPELIDRILGIGGSTIRENQRFKVIGGYVFIDRNAVERVRSPARWEFVATHELLHAIGISAHVDPDPQSGYPESVLVPLLDPRITEVPRLFTTLDGELLLVNQLLDPGTAISDLTSDDFDFWEVDGFHLLGTMKMADDDDPVVEFGVGLRNGLAKPWATGPTAIRPLRTNPEFAGHETATWRGSLLGFTRQDLTTTGDAMIELNLRNWQGLAAFSQIETWQENGHPGARGSGEIWNDGDLSYTIQTHANRGIDGFESIAADGNDPGSVTGVFTGNLHQGAAGILEHPNLSAAFGGVRGDPE
ncbi:MAG: hypothetical protein OXF20_01770 [Gammaproteobacteria bacterium]|nr:hypothetical protein [Gammaproteobacteria bacterium]